MAGQQEKISSLPDGGSTLSLADIVPIVQGGTTKRATLGQILGLISTTIVPPTLSSTTIQSSGTSISLVFSVAVQFGAGGNAGWTLTLSGGAVTMTYSSGSGTNTLVYSLNRTIQSTETGTISYTQPGNGIEDINGNNMVSIVSASVTNDSDQAGLCATATVSPSYDESIGSNWTASGYSAPPWYPGISDASDSTFMYAPDNSGGPIVFRFTLPGNCNIDHISVNARIAAAGAADSWAVDVSKDNTNWSATQNFITNSGYYALTNVSMDYTSLGYTNPAYIYVRFTFNSGNYVNGAIYELSITLNP